MSAKKRAKSSKESSEKKAKRSSSKTLSQKAKNATKGKKRSSSSKRQKKNTTAEASSSFKLLTNLNDKRKAKKEEKKRKKAEYLATLPKNRWKRLAYRLHPKRQFKYWFSKEGGLMALKVAGIGMLALFIFVIGLFAYFRRDLPDPRDISSRLLNQTTKFYDRTGEHLLYEVYGAQNRTVVEFDQISDYAKWATVAIEDKDFYDHGGFSFSGIARAAWSNVRSDGSTQQGGSTITQQFIKNSLLSNERTYTRKVKELILAIELERLYTKDEILGFYLNEIPYGSQEYGVEAAAQSFFRKPASELTIAESAMMAALPQAPTYYSPYGQNTDDLIARQHHIIGLMAEQGYISQEEAEDAKEFDILATITPIEERSLYTNIEAPHFVIEIQQQLENEFGPSLVRNGGLKIITTLDMELQEIAEESVENNMATVESPAAGGGSGDNAALVATESQTGQVLALVGSRDFDYPEYGSYNAAVANRQPGSSFKPFGYAELFKNDRWGPDSLIYDTPTSFGDYNPKNFDFGYRGSMKVREALGESRNIPAVKALYIAGVENTVNLAKSMGNHSLGDPDVYGLSVVLGAGEVKLAEHTNAYATFARGGKYKEQTYILKIENADGEVLKEYNDEEGEQVLDEQIAYLVTDMLLDDAARSGTFGRNNPRLVVPGVTHTVKTGTTDRSVDGWMMGYTAHMAVGVWVGNHDNVPMDSITSWQTGPIFTEFMRRAHEDLEDKPIFESRPEGIQTITMDRSTGYAATESSGNKYTGIFPSWYKKQTREEAQKVTLDSVSNKIATECTPERAKKEGTTYGKWPELLPSDPWYNLWGRSAGYGGAASSGEKDDVHKCSDKKPSVSISATELAPGIYQFSSTIAKGTHKLDKLNFMVDGQIVSAQSASNPGTYTYIHKFTSSGTKKVTAEVIDSVLYDNSNSTNVKVTSTYSGGGLDITSPTDGSSVDAPVTFTWSSDPDADSYEICWDGHSGGSEICKSHNQVDSLTYTPSSGITSGETYSLYVKSFVSGIELQTSSVINFTVN